MGDLRHLVVVNPKAGRARGGASPEVLRDAFARRHLTSEIVPTEYAGHARRIVAERGRAFDAVVVAGGDGTLHEVLQSLDLERHILGLIPVGTGNDFAWMEGWPRDPEACVDRMARREERRVDIGVCTAARFAAGATTVRFHNNAGLGFEALVNEASHRITKLHGPLVYVAALLQSLRRFRRYDVRVAWEGGSFEGKTAMVSVTNGRRVGGAFLLSPAARHDDGKLDLLLAPEAGLLGTLVLAARSFRGAHLKSRGVRVAQAPEIRVEASHGIPLYVDGEFLGPAFMSVGLSTKAGALRTF